MSNINWGIIGCGDVTEKKSGPALYKVPNSSLIAVMRRNAEKAADYARRHNVGKWYDDADKLLNDPEINSVYIATPPASHMDYALAALKKGLNVYIEKPVTLNAAEARIIAEAAKQSKGRVCIAHYRRSLPLFLYVKELIDTGAIGDIRMVQIRLWQSLKPELVTHVADNWRIQPALSGGGYFHDMSPHQLDLMLFYFGEPQYYTGFSLNQSNINPADDHVSGLILFKKDIVVNGSWSFNVAPGDAADSVEIIGSKGKISFASFVHFDVILENEAGKTVKTFKHPEHISQLMVEKVVNYFNGDQAENPCSIEDAIPLMDIMDAFSVHR
jgi:predicted dehydrogenase